VTEVVFCCVKLLNTFLRHLQFTYNKCHHYPYCCTVWYLYSLILVKVCTLLVLILQQFFQCLAKTLSVDSKSKGSVACKVILCLQNWACPSCHGLCNCSICHTREGKRPTEILVPFVKSEGYSNVKEYLEFEGD
jgi:hypothetical protein